MDIVFYALIISVVIILLIGVSIANHSGNLVRERFNQMDKHQSSSFTVASDFAVQVSINYLNSKVRVGLREGDLTDAYQPANKVVFLSSSVYNNSSVAALAVAAHELGHAMQDHKNPKTLRKLERLGRLAKVLGMFMFPLLITAVIMFFAMPEQPLYALLSVAGAIGIFLLALFVKLLTISIEKDASKKAISFLRELKVLEGTELKLAKKLLDAALLTYIGDFLRAILGWTLLTKKTKLFG